MPQISLRPGDGRGKAERFDRAKCYEGKENSARLLVGQYGHLFYDVSCSKMGSPLLKKTRGPSAAFAGRGDRFGSLLPHLTPVRAAA